MAEEKKTPQTEPKAQGDRKARVRDDQTKVKPRKEDTTVCFTDFASI